MVHSGFEASAVHDGFSSWRGFLAMARASLFGPRVPAPAGGALAEATAAPPAAESPPPGSELDATPESLRAAFAYRGDVTLVLDDGSRLEGFVANAGPEVLSVWPRGESGPRSLATARVRRVVFSGRDLVERGRAVAERGRERVALRVASGAGAPTA